MLDAQYFKFNHSKNQFLIKIFKATSGQVESNNHELEFVVNLEIHEEEKGTFIPVPFDKESFKLRRGFEKKVQVTVNQTAGLVLPIERCFGLLLCPGRLARAADMTLLDMELGKNIKN